MLAICFYAFTKAQPLTETDYNLNRTAKYSRRYTTPPRFDYQGGLLKYFKDDIRFPDNLKTDQKGQLIFHAVIDTSGKIIDPWILRGVSKEIDAEFLRVVKLAPHAQPALFNQLKIPFFIAFVINISADAQLGTISIDADPIASVKEYTAAMKVFDIAPDFTASGHNIYKYINDNLKYPANATNSAKGTLKLYYIIDTLGKITDIRINKNVSAEADDAIINILGKAPAYTPGTLYGHKVKVGYTMMLDVDLNTATKTITAQRYIDTNKTYTSVEVPPSFPGGNDRLYQFISQNVRYPESARAKKIEGRVFISFVVEKDGHLSDIKVVRSPDESLSEEALRVLKLLPRWNPGTQNGKPVRVMFTVPINFSLGGN